MTNLSIKTDVLAVLAKYTHLRKVASTHGGEWAGPCPACGGRDRFLVWPEQGRYWCRKCDAKGDAIQALRDFEHLSFKEACQELHVDLPERAVPMAPVEPPIEAPDDNPPFEAWQTMARAFLSYCQAELWKPTGEKALAYLQGRGLKEATILAWGIGFNPTDLKDQPEKWGLTGKDVWLSRGVTLPCQEQGQTWYVKTRRPMAGDGLDQIIGGGLEPVNGKAQAKYLQIRGGKPALYGAHTLEGHDSAFAVEGEFDCMVLDQEVGSLTGVCTLGSASMPLVGRWLWAFRDCLRIFAAYDQDKAGAKGADRLKAISARVRLARVLQGKDITDFYLAGGHLRDWVLYWLQKDAPSFSTPSPTPVPEPVEASTPIPEPTPEPVATVAPVQAVKAAPGPIEPDGVCRCWPIEEAAVMDLTRQCAHCGNSAWCPRCRACRRCWRPRHGQTVQRLAYQCSGCGTRWTLFEHQSLLECSKCGSSLVEVSP